MPTRTSRNLLAGLAITLGMVMLISAPTTAADGDDGCASFTVDFDDQGVGPLHIANTSIGPVAITLPAGTYDIVMTSTDPTHAPGAFSDQQHESWFFNLDNGYTSPVTPDFGDAEPGVSILVQGVVFDAPATQVTAIWAGVAPAADSVHATISFTCVRDTIPTTSTTAATSTTDTTAQSSTTAAASTTEVTSTTTALLPTTLVPTTQAGQPTTTVGEIGGTTEENPELAATGTNLNLAIGGITLVAAGFGLVVAGAVADRRKLAVVRI